MFLVSSNPRKLKELARYGLELDLRSGDDLPEVDGTPLEVAIHKAKLAGPGAVMIVFSPDSSKGPTSRDWRGCISTPSANRVPQPSEELSAR